MKIADRPTSNPLPPGTEALSKSQNVSSAQQILDSVAQEVPNFGTEQVIVVSLFMYRSYVPSSKYAYFFFFSFSMFRIKLIVLSI